MYIPLSLFGLKVFDSQFSPTGACPRPAFQELLAGIQIKPMCDNKSYAEKPIDFRISIQIQATCDATNDWIQPTSCVQLVRMFGKFETGLARRFPHRHVRVPGTFLGTQVGTAWDWKLLSRECDVSMLFTSFK